MGFNQRFRSLDKFDSNIIIWSSYDTHLQISVVSSLKHNQTISLSMSSVKPRSVAFLIQRHLCLNWFSGLALFQIRRASSSNFSQTNMAFSNPSFLGGPVIWLMQQSPMVLTASALCTSVFQNQNGLFVSVSNKLDCCVVVIVISNVTRFFRSLNVKFLFSSLFILYSQHKLQPLLSDIRNLQKIQKDFSNVYQAFLVFFWKSFVYNFAYVLLRLLCQKIRSLLIVDTLTCI